MTWQVQEAKQRFSEVVRAAEAGEPQIVTKHGREVVVILDFSEYRRLCGHSLPLMDYLRVRPDLEVEIEIERAHDLPREIDLAT
jgi:prevent-host-death family protein